MQINKSLSQFQFNQSPEKETKTIKTKEKKLSLDKTISLIQERMCREPLTSNIGSPI